MHVLIAAHDFYPDPGSGGTGRYVYETARRFVERGHRVSVVTRRRGDVPNREEVNGIRIVRYDLTIATEWVGSIATQLPRSMQSVARGVADLASNPSGFSGGNPKESFPDIVESTTEEPDLVSFQGPITALLVDRITDESIPRVATFHSPWPTEYRIRTRDAPMAPWRRSINIGIRRFLESRLLSRCSDVVTLSSFMQDALVNGYGGQVPGIESTVIPGGVDTDRYAPDAGTFEPMGGEHTVFLTVRRLSPRMGHSLLLRAFSGVLEDHPDCQLFIAGDGPLRDEVSREARTLGIDENTTFLGYISDAQLPAAYATADVFVLPTTELEGFGLVTLEAIAAGTPVIGTPVGATTEVLGRIDERDELPEPLLLPATTVEDLRQSMSKWAGLDPEKRRSGGTVCRDHIRDRYSWDGTVDALESLYRDLVQDER